MDLRIKIILGILGAVFIVMIGVLGFALNTGEQLAYDEYSFLDVSSMTDSVSATCLNHYGDVISTTYKYDDLVADCQLTKTPQFSESDFYDGVFVVFFYDGSSSSKPKAFYDYFFMADNHEVITVRYHHSLFGKTKDGQTYMYFIYMKKDQIQSSEILFR